MEGRVRLCFYLTGVDLCRDSKPETRNLLKSGVTDGSFQRPEELLAPLIAPLSHPRPLSHKPLPNSEFGLMTALAAVEPRATCPESRLFAHVDCLCEIRPMAFLDTVAFFGVNPCPEAWHDLNERFGLFLTFEH